MHSPKKIPQQLQRDREQKHYKLMKLIDAYELTKEEKQKLEKLKSRTTMEINLRFLKSQINRNYNFPKSNPQKSILNSLVSTISLREQLDEQMDKELKQQFQKLQERSKHNKKTHEYWTYDLHSQNGTKISKRERDNNSRTNSTKALSFENNRKVHSLGNDKSLQKQKQGLITKRHSPLKISNQRVSNSPLSGAQSLSTRSLKPFKPISLTITQSKQKLTESKHIQRFSPLQQHSEKLIVGTRKLKLPQINSPSPLNQSKVLRKLNLIHEKLKTEKHYDEEGIIFALGKKLVTEIIDSGKRPIKGVEKYLKQLQAEKKKQFHINPNNQRFMKKDKEKLSQKIN